MNLIKKNSIQVLFFSLLLILLNNCNQDKKFDSVIWNQKGVDWSITEVREIMVADLIESDTLIGLHQTEILELLGRPSEIKNLKFHYLIREKYGWNIDPIYIKYLLVEFDTSAVAIKCEVVK